MKCFTCGKKIEGNPPVMQLTNKQKVWCSLKCSLVKEKPSGKTDK